MLHSRIVPAFLCVALAHAALIAFALKSEPASLPRAVQSSAPIVARLLSPAAGPAPEAAAHGQPPAKPPAALTRTAVHSAPLNPPHPRPNPRQPAPAPSTASHQETASTSAPLPEPNPPTAPAANAKSAATQSSVNPSNANDPSSVRSDAKETLAISAPRHVEHADCRIAKPSYPELSRRRGETGTASVRFVIGTTGAVENVALLKSSGFARLDDAALDALHASTCAPYLENGAPVRVSYVQAFTFGLEGE